MQERMRRSASKVWFGLEKGGGGDLPFENRSLLMLGGRKYYAPENALRKKIVVIADMVITIDLKLA